MKYIGYVRVSTDRQGKSGLGLESQQESITSFVAGAGGELVKIYVEVESGKIDNRPVLLEAIRHSQLINGKLVIAKLDRLSRSLGFITDLQKNHVDFAVVDLPGADKFTIHLYGALAEKERSMISDRTKQALQAAKARGVKLGNKKGSGITPEIQQKGAISASTARIANADTFSQLVKPMIERLQGEGNSLSAIARALNAADIPTARGKKWTATAVNNALARI